LAYSKRIFGTPMPEGILDETGDRMKLLRRPVMDFLFLRAFRPDHPDCRLPFSNLALSLLYMRSHYLRMPLYLLLPHLARKAWRRHIDKQETVDAPDEARHQPNAP